MREIEAGHVRPSLAFDVLNEEPPYAQMKTSLSPMKSGGW